MNPEQSVALGERPPDRLVRGGRVLFPTVGEFRRRDVAIVGESVAALPEDGTDLAGEETTVIAADGQHVVPGFVDAHTHLDLHAPVERSYHLVLAGGTTTVVSEVAGFGTAFGAAGVRQFLAATADLPLDVRATVPPQPLVDTFEPSWADAEETLALADLLAEERVVGVGETDWIHVVGRDVPAEALYERAREEGKPISGHGAGCSGGKLAAFASVVDDDHEAITGEGMVERLENAIHVIGRSGSIRDDVAAVADAYDEVGAADISLSTDGMWPPELLADGYVDEVLRRTIAAGVEPEDAIRMATVNPARHFGLDDRGELAPGKRADLVILDDLEAVRIETVLAGGRLVVEGGEPTVEPRRFDYPDWFVGLSVDVGPDSDRGSERFRVPADETVDGRVRAIENREGLVTAETTVEPQVVEGFLTSDPENDVCKAAFVDSHPQGDGESFTGFLTGLGLREGAAATSITWEAAGVVVVGADEADMATAVECVGAMGGGWAVVRDGEVLANLPTPIGGVCADLPIEAAAERYEAVESALRSLGVAAEKPALAIQTLTFPGVPALKLARSGYADVFDRTIVGLAPD